MHYLSPLLGVLILVTLLYVGYVTYPIARALVVGGRLVDQAVPYEQHPENACARILIAGDSTGAGVGAAPTESVAGRIGSTLPGADIRNISKSGAKLAGLKEMLGAHPDSGYDLIVLQIGANDIVGGTPSLQVRQDLRLVLDRAEELGANTIVLTSGDVGLAPIFRFPISKVLHDRTLVVRLIFMSEITERKTAAYVDLFKEAGNDPFLQDVRRYYSPDFFHPSGEGYGVWFMKVKDALTSLKLCSQ